MLKSTRCLYLCIMDYYLFKVTSYSDSVIEYEDLGLSFTDYRKLVSHLFRFYSLILSGFKKTRLDIYFPHRVVYCLSRTYEDRKVYFIVYVK